MAKIPSYPLPNGSNFWGDKYNELLTEMDSKGVYTDEENTFQEDATFDKTIYVDNIVANTINASSLEADTKTYTIDFPSGGGSYYRLGSITWDGAETQAQVDVFVASGNKFFRGILCLNRGQFGSALTFYEGIYASFTGAYIEFYLNSSGSTSTLYVKDTGSQSPQGFVTMKGEIVPDFEYVDATIPSLTIVSENITRSAP